MSKLEDAHRIKFLLHRRWKTYCDNLRLWISPKDYHEMKRTMCPMCGQNIKEPVSYFGDQVCLQCRQKADPNNLYQKNLQGKMGFKIKL